MADTNLGGVYYEVDAKTGNLLKMNEGVSSSIDKLVGQFAKVDNSTKKNEQSYNQAGAAAKAMATDIDKTAKSALTAISAYEKLSSELQQQRASVSSFIAKLKEQSETLGLSATELAKYQAAKLGASEKDQQIVANLRAQIDAYEKNQAEIRKNQAALDAIEQQQNQNKASVAAMVQALQNQAATLGMTTRQIILHKAAQEGATDAEIKAIKSSLNQIDAFERQARAARDSRSELSNNANAAGLAVRPVNQLGGVAQNLGYQLQDVAIQAQMGTSALVILGQQGSQFLAAFGAYGAAAGAVLAISAAVGSSLLPSLFESNRAAADLDETMKKLSETTVETDDNIRVITKSIEDLAKVSKAAAQAEITAGLVRAKQAAEQAGKAIQEAFDQNISTGDWVYDIGDAIRYVNVNTPQATRFMQDFGAELGASGKDAEKTGREIIRLISNVQTLKTPESFKALQERLAEISTGSGNVSDKMKLLISDLNAYFMKAYEAADATKFLKEAQADLSKILTKGTESVTSATVELGKQIGIQKTLTEQGALAAKLLSQAFSMGLTSAEQLPEHIREMVKELHNLGRDQEVNQLTSDLKMQAAQLTMATNEFEVYAAVKSAEAKGASADQIKAIKDEIRNLQDLRLAREAVSDIATEKDQKRKDDETARNKITTEFQQVQTGFTQQTETPAQKAMRENEERLAVIRQYQALENADKEAALEAQLQSEQLYADQMAAIRESQGSAFKKTLESLGFSYQQLGNQAAGSLALIATGAMTGKEAIRSLAQSILTQAIGALIQLGIQAAIGQTAVTAGSIASGAAIATAMAPAAAMTSLATAGANSAPASAGILSTVGVAQAAAIGGGRLYGGPVQAGTMYPITENGKPEILQQGNKQYLLPGSSGNVISNKDMMAQGGSNVSVEVNVQNMNGSQVDVKRSQGPNRKEIIDIIVADIGNRGQTYRAITSTTSARGTTR